MFQRGGGYFDVDGNLILDNEIAVQTVMWFVPLVAGSERIACDQDAFAPSFANSINDGYCLAFLCPDWMSRYIEKSQPRTAGKMALMPLPAFSKGGRRTGTMGGTMAGITRKCRDKELAWELVKKLYMDTEGLPQRFRDTNILPPFKHLWSNPVFYEKRDYWSGQAVGKAYIELAEEVPPQYGSPYLELAKDKLGVVVAACAAYYESNGEQGFESFVRDQLKQAAGYIRFQMKRNTF